MQIASKYTANVVIEKDDVKVDGRSIMGILTLGAGSESTVRLTCDGEDAEALFAELEELLMRDNIDEEQQ
ncbi:MAG: HPr family phosphocarrier protein [Candidatus Omnitrophica bacterium]|nr:HPr family phosphocarrier protein [Candidatus Omnitrophota bacterium]